MAESGCPCRQTILACSTGTRVGAASLQTVEGLAGVSSPLQHDKGVLFIYWTADGYNHTGNYNLDKPAFVQTNSSWVLGGAFNSYSTRDGDQREFLMHWQRDTSNGNWWLFLQGSGALTPIGYYPRALFGSGQMASFATEIDYGGEVTGTTSGQMGSGAFAAEGYRRAAYQRAIACFPTSGASRWATLTADQDHPELLLRSICTTQCTAGDWATYFFLGRSSLRLELFALRPLDSRPLSPRSGIYSSPMSPMIPLRPWIPTDVAPGRDSYPVPIAQSPFAHGSRPTSPRSGSFFLIAQSPFAHGSRPTSPRSGSYSFPIAQSPFAHGSRPTSPRSGSCLHSHLAALLISG